MSGGVLGDVRPFSKESPVSPLTIFLHCDAGSFSSKIRAGKGVGNVPSRIYAENRPSSACSAKVDTGFAITIRASY
jgi:hypothetical protein